ncbi:uncharacterized protein Z519_01677 [Cladophialophora bantiana CBS 173.52]|uniref:Uncharacterized protein n=1 Tax=Cladophialophora bantiana (strain ATCC 10958 / CBS 173.52 / CDC B-1940 / NIH 8579) TaxID=1442370 RepID=A0A0D2HXH6_CLAB1|nr:uncharacterized protein Z519_01677 [Cladophialophora bantiana CBS 173.52]KIW98093.1 hypothetical protein Z519_01677 [Cladophialophora bantiana CBS 173.52]
MHQARSDFPRLPKTEPDADHGGDFNNHFPVPSVNGSTSRFYGSSSVFALMVEALALASDKNLFIPSGPPEPPLSGEGRL